MSSSVPSRLFVSTHALGSMGMCLAYFDASDIAEIYAVEQRSHASPWNEQHFVSSVPCHHCIGLRLNNAWLGHAIVSLNSHEAELLLFVVDKAYQGKGFGTAFLQSIMELCKPHTKSMFLEVRASNHVAIQLYQSRGFNELGLRPNYYPRNGGGREDALILGCEFVE